MIRMNGLREKNNSRTRFDNSLLVCKFSQPPMIALPHIPSLGEFAFQSLHPLLSHTDQFIVLLKLVEERIVVI